MSKPLKLLIGLVAVLLLGLLNHGPLSNGDRFIATLEAHARRAVAETKVPQINVRVSRDPLARVATLSGPADNFQRHGMGSFKGLTERVDDVPGIAQVRWADEPTSGGIVLPLLAEILLLVTLAYLLGLGLGWLFFRSREGRYA